MNQKICLPGPRLQEKQRVSPPDSSFISRAIWFTAGLGILIVAIGLLITVLFLTTHKIRVSQSGREFLASSIYAAMIAPISAVVLNWVAHRYSDKFPRLVFLFLALAQTATDGGYCA